MRRLLMLACCSAACGDAPPAPARPAADSTIAARDYVGPRACGECHPDEHARWSRSLHAVMNERAGASAVIGDFTKTLAYRDGSVELARTPTASGEAFTMTVARRGEAGIQYRVTRTIGKRALQEYVGIPASADAARDADEVRLPFGWWPRRGGWYAQPYYDPWLDEDAFDAYAPIREPWAERCPWCHSTYPFAQRIARSAARSVGHGLEQYFTLAADRPHVDRLAVAEQVTTGISCESCHLGGRAHAAGGPIHFVPLGASAQPGAPVPTTFASERADPAIVNRVCAQCHSGPSPRFPDGTATRNSSEALDLAASRCASVRCVDCHDPHRPDAAGDRTATERRALASCNGCHATIADRGADHAGHTAGDATCLDCHMPRVVLGIDGHVRTHRISSPTDPAMLATAAPNACNLCHLDRPIEWTTRALTGRHVVALDPRPWRAYTPETPVGEIWLASKQPAIRLIAAAAYARSPLGRAALPDIARLLDDPLPHVRAYGTFAVEDILGRRLLDDEYDPRLPGDARRRQLAGLIARTPSAHTPVKP